MQLWSEGLSVREGRQAWGGIMNVLLGCGYVASHMRKEAGSSGWGWRPGRPEMADFRVCSSHTEECCGPLGRWYLHKHRQAGE